MKNPHFLFMGRIDLVECIGVSGQRNGNVLNVKPPAIRVRNECYTKNHLSIIIGVFRPLSEKGKVILWQSKRIRSHTRSGCVNTTSSSTQSIDEKLSIINMKRICVTCGSSCVITRVWKYWKGILCPIMYICL